MTEISRDTQLRQQVNGLRKAVTLEATAAVAYNTALEDMLRLLAEPPRIDCQACGRPTAKAERVWVFSTDPTPSEPPSHIPTPGLVPVHIACSR